MQKSMGTAAVGLILALTATACSSSSTSASTASSVPTPASEVVPEAVATVDTEPRPLVPTSLPNDEDAIENELLEGSREPTLADSLAVLREALDVTVVVARSGVGDASDEPLVVSTNESVFELDERYWLQVFPNFLSAGNRVFDYRGQQVCPMFELNGDFHVVVSIEDDDGFANIFVEDRRLVAMASRGELFEQTDIWRWMYSCRTGEFIEVEPTSTIQKGGDPSTFTRLTTSGLTLIEERGLGDTPLILRTESGTVLIDGIDPVYDYHLSADDQTAFFTTYRGTGAAEPPLSVTAVDVTTGEELWTQDVPGDLWVAGDRIVVQVADFSDPETLPSGVPTEVVVLDAESGEELQRTPFTGRLVGLK